MAISYKGFQVYYCNPTTLENLQYCRAFEFCIVSQSGNASTVSASDDTIKNRLSAVIPDLSSTGGLALITANMVNDYLPRIQSILPLSVLFGTVNTTGIAAKLKLVAANGSYAVSTGTIANGNNTFGNSYQSIGYVLYDAQDNPIGATLELTAYGGNSCTFMYVNGYSGGDLPLLSSSNCGYYNISRNGNDTSYLERRSYNISSAVSQAVTNWFNGISPLVPPPPEDTDPYSGIDGGGGMGGGTVGIPGFPALTASSTGIVGLFAPSALQMQQLASFMWTDFGGTATTTEGVLSEIVEAIKRLISNPLDYILGLNIIPSQGLSVGGSSVIKFGYISSNISMPRLSNQYFIVDCGSISFPPLCGDTFLDYAPYSKFSIYLPYIGVKDVDANDFVGHTIGVVYHGDTVTGGVTAYITKDGSVMYQYSGSCALNIPLSSDNWGSTLSAAVNIATAVVAGAATGGAAGVGVAAAKGAASVAANPSQLSPQVQHSGAVSGSAGCMGVQYPFVIREAVRFHSTEYFNTISGYPSFYYRQLADVSGFTTVVNVHLENIPATQGEIAEIERLLKEGVIL